MQQEMICICCPLGCHMTVCTEPDGAITVTGNTCPRGKQYAENYAHRLPCFNSHRAQRGV